MMKQISFLVIALVVLLGNIGLSQVETKTDSITLQQFEIIDSALISVIDSFIASEQCCTYYSDSLRFSIQICD